MHQDKVKFFSFSSESERKSDLTHQKKSKEAMKILLNTHSLISSLGRSEEAKSAT